MYFHYSGTRNGDCASTMSHVRAAVCELLYGADRNLDYVRWNDSMIHRIDGELEGIWKKANVL
jgi:hypothetical protein